MDGAEPRASNQGISWQVTSDHRAEESPSPYPLRLPRTENGTLLWTPKVLEPFTLEILARKANVNLSSVLQPKTVACFCSAESQCVYNQTRWVGNSSMEVSVGNREEEGFCVERKESGN